ncbi:TIGR04283 family arsenosugar biosynthesis glycosyltransferase [Geomonas subterranea]|uniref:TIGR04283 family arsenosugar biosynthesis glycosyltransferase n=1 Tax=Geomonas subterranea TaxID=2847989 RepID=A0ABX8LBB1_9BACT|nr:TIGR04283 family arsenosugar biosynthesis glycosyltransferase [Geomonas subterranea]QXE89298.1 TIGR04283 family arsenosugar biosynthesis glycosyltransferase [Geomonas subterranea]QXM08589.1 TIGR04283 family arsenosugar biosynthesis glycosyltransferase [Geomonas subterranea]
MPFDVSPELSVVVPVYNEEGNVAPFLAALSRQQGVSLEVILSDGASSDRTVHIAREECGKLPFPLTVIEGAKGRGGQLNRGVEAARAATLLFLHIDSAFEDPLALRKGVDALEEALPAGERVAGRFALRFGFPGSAPLPYRFYGAKAALDRPGCTHGDQGFLIRRDFFAQIGPYDTSLPLMEDTFLAERVRREGRWLLLPASITTSPRRFLAEGLLPRQTLNAILMNLAHIRQLSLIRGLQASYRSQDATARLKLKPFLVALHQAIGGLDAGERRRLWWRTGAYVRGNAWQIAFFLDVVTGGIREEGRGGRVLHLYDRFLARLIDNRGGDLAAALLTWLWFRLTLLVARDRG